MTTNGFHSSGSNVAGESPYLGSTPGILKERIKTGRPRKCDGLSDAEFQIYTLGYNNGYQCGYKKMAKKIQQLEASLATLQKIINAP